MKVLMTAIVYIVVLAIVGVLAFFGALLLAGPHGGVLPNAAAPAVLILAWLFVLVVPVLAARFAWNRMRKGAERPM